MLELSVHTLSDNVSHGVSLIYNFTKEWSSEDEDEVPYKGSPARPVGKSQQGASSRVLKTLPRDLVGLVSTDQHGRVDSGRTWLDQNLMVQYWEGQGHTDLSYSREATLSSDWYVVVVCFLLTKMEKLQRTDISTMSLMNYINIPRI